MRAVDWWWHGVGLFSISCYCYVVLLLPTCPGPAPRSPCLPIPSHTLFKFSFFFFLFFFFSVLRVGCLFRLKPSSSSFFYFFFGCVSSWVLFVLKLIFVFVKFILNFGVVNFFYNLWKNNNIVEGAKFNFIEANY